MTNPGQTSRGSFWGRVNCDTCEESTKDQEVVLVFKPDSGHGHDLKREHPPCFFGGNEQLRARYEGVIAAVAARKRPRMRMEEGICNLCDDSTRGKDILAVSNPADRSREIHVHFDCFMDANLVEERTRTARPKSLGDRILDDLEFPKKP